MTKVAQKKVVDIPRTDRERSRAFLALEKAAASLYKLHVDDDATWRDDDTWRAASLVVDVVGRLLRGPTSESESWSDDETYALLREAFVVLRHAEEGFRGLPRLAQRVLPPRAPNTVRQ